MSGIEYLTLLAIIPILLFAVSGVGLSAYSMANKKYFHGITVFIAMMFVTIVAADSVLILSDIAAHKAEYKLVNNPDGTTSWKLYYNGGKTKEGKQ